MLNGAADSGSQLDALLAAHVTGGLGRPLAALLDAHLELSPVNRGFVRALEAAAGARLEGMGEAVPLADRDGMLDRVFAAEGPSPRLAPPPARTGALPAALRAYLGRDLDDAPWKALLPGVRQQVVEHGERGEAVLYRIRGGRKMPTHTHEGTEITLVLQGAFSDATGRYARGDVAVADEHLDHRPVAEPGADCICFAVTDAPLRLTGPLGRWLQKLRG
jgi:putative transcriptional regulator